MWEVIRSFFIAVLLGFFTVASAQLPPKIMADKHLILAEQLYAAKDYVAAFKVMEKVIALQQEHSLTLSDEFHFKYAQVALSADSTRIALESVTRYLSATGEEGKFYNEALTLMLKAEGNEVMTAEEFYNEVIKAEGTCEGLPVGSSCWMALANHPECYVWNADLQEGETAIWAGGCSGYSPEGEGTLTVEYIYDRDSEGRPKKRHEKSTGSFQKGRRHGQWVYYYYYSGGSVSEEGPYVEGKRHGQWVHYHKEDSENEDGVSEVPYVEGKKHGLWIGSFKEKHGGDLYWYKVLYLDNTRHDGWRYTRHLDWSVEHEGPDENGNGHIIYRNPDGAVWGGPYVNGKRHGKWVWYIVKSEDTDTVEEGSYVEGERQGEWVYRDPGGAIWGGGAYVEGKKHGRWVDWPNHWYLDEDFYRRFVGEGSYVEGEEQGEWVYRHPNGDILKIEWENGDPNSPVLWYDYDEEKCWSTSRYSPEEKKKKVNKKMCLE